MQDPEALELFAQLVEKKLNYKITEVQRILFQCFWNKLLYKEIKVQYNLIYTEEHIRTLGSELSLLGNKLSNSHGINKTNFRTILEPYLQEQQKASNHTGSSIAKYWNFHSRLFYLSRQAEKRDWYSQEDYWDLATITQQIIELINQDEKYHHYQEIADRWKLIKNFTHVYDKYWTQRKQILEWLLAGAKQKNDNSLIAEAMSELGLTLILLRPHQKETQLEAEFYLKEARKLTKSQEFNLWVDVNINIAVLSLAQQRPDLADGHLLVASKSLSEQWADQNLRNRCLSHLHYYEGECNFWFKNYQKADKQYKLATKYAHMIGWERAKVAAKNWRAEIAIELGNLNLANNLLTDGLAIVLKHEDYRSAALHYRSLVWLNKEKGNQENVLKYATNAESKFQMLGMNIEATEMQKILAEIN